MAQKELPVFSQAGLGRADASEIWSTQLGVAVEAMSKIGASAEDIAAIGITNQRETAIVWDRHTGEPVYRAIVWQCRRTSEYCDSLKEKGLTEVFRKKTGLIIDAYFAGTKVKWILIMYLVHGKKQKRRSVIRNGGDVADLEIDKGSCSCDRLFQRIPYIVVQYQYSGLG